ncbi:glycerophosphoinositol inositolphosphodiesterase GDPD2-like isoform X2 [Stegostoma tigrinum]|uniref:glycerophosphoinositol inositolphosphodiesterase GDPD2-like isoform X2 n=1 Tax=Stegostoma tigrinum TaxID=3053191 RepID=UPI00202ACB9C|nr:glycerophosphoinositol inositolphosphodiesterase GDPD2-like isoform X2 [Stegostoma tigrinum]
MMERLTMLQSKKLCLACVTGIYGCQWRKYRTQLNKKSTCIWCLILCCAFGISAFWFYCWWALRNDYSNLNEHLFAKMHRWLDWSVILLILTAIIFSYLLLLMILSLCHFALQIPLYLHWINKVAILICVLLILILMIVIRIKWKEEWDTISLSIQVTAPFLHLGAIVAVTIMAWFVIDQFFQSKRNLMLTGLVSQTSRKLAGKKRKKQLEQTVLQVIIPMFYLGVVIILYFIPLAISSPCIIEREDLAPRPAMMGHRGAPMLAPENTLMSFEETVKCEATTFESDVQISFDGVPFLMHDSTFERTTDIADVFPKRARSSVSSFTWAEIQKLNAGKWFLKILWLPNNTNSTPKDFQKIVGEKLDPDALQRQNIHNINIRYSDINFMEIRNYAEKNISINLYVVNERWLFSTLWCVKVNSVTTNACHIFKNMHEPIWHITPGTYKAIWITVDLVSFLLIVLIYVLHRSRHRKIQVGRGEENIEDTIL